MFFKNQIFKGGRASRHYLLQFNLTPHPEYLSAHWLSTDLAGSLGPPPQDRTCFLVTFQVHHGGHAPVPRGHPPILMEPQPKLAG